MSRQTVEALAARGFPLVWLRPGTKEPARSRWTERQEDPGEWNGQNVGVLLGTEVQPGRYLADVDFDADDCLLLARELLLPTGFGFGRASRPISHAFYLTPQPVRHTPFADPVSHKMILEIRGLKADGSIGFQTMVPPSTHPSGERLELRADGDPAFDEALVERGRRAAVAYLLYKYLGQRAFRHATRLALAGFLLKFEAETNVIAIAQAVARHTGNDVEDVKDAVRTTKTRMDAGQRVTAEGDLIKALGDHGRSVVQCIWRWYGHAHSAVVVSEGQLSSIVDRAQERLLRRGGIYQRGGQLVRPIRVPTAGGDAVRRAAHSLVLDPLNVTAIVEQLSLVAEWYSETRTGEHRRIDPPPRYAQHLLARREWPFPVLHGVVCAPTLSRDGRIIEQPGFDADSGLYLDFAPGVFPSVPQEPSMQAAGAALNALAHPLRRFPFVDEASKAVALAAMLTAVVRPSLQTAPLHGYDAPTAGTGKSMLAEVAGLLATGVRPPALSQGKTPEEDEKRLSTVLMAGDTVIHIDNCEREVSGDFLCSMLTQQTVQARILGLSERRVLPCTALVLASGNNLTLAGDVSRRAVLCRLDAQTERPDTRTFDFDCHAEILANRPNLLVAAVTVLRAYDVAGRPERLTPMGSFPDWEWIRGALVWLGYADPAATRQAILDNDPRRDDLQRVMDLWAKGIGAGPPVRTDAKARARRVELHQINVPATIEGLDALQQFAVEELAKSLAEITGGVWNARRVSSWLRRHKDRVVGGRAFRSVEGRDRKQWWLETVPGAGQRAFALDEGVPAYIEDEPEEGG